MQELIQRISEEATVLSDTVLKVDSFLNHQVDPLLMESIGKQIAEKFKTSQITKVFTIESSGIAPAVFTALHLGVQLVILKKSSSKTLNGDVYQHPVISYTKNTTYELTLSKQYINRGDNVLIVDDFLAQGQAGLAAAKLVEAGGGKVVAFVSLIEKSFQKGKKLLEEKGYKVCSLAPVASLENGTVTFLEADI